MGSTAYVGISCWSDFSTWEDVGSEEPSKVTYWTTWSFAAEWGPLLLGLGGVILSYRMVKAKVASASPLTENIFGLVKSRDAGVATQCGSVVT